MKCTKHLMLPALAVMLLVAANSHAGPPPAQRTKSDAEKTIEMVDSALQQRFSTVMPEVGRSRLVAAIPNHPGAYKLAEYTKAQQQSIASANKMNIEYLVGFLGVDHALGNRTRKRGATSPTSELKPLPVQFRTNATLTAASSFKSANKQAKNVIALAGKGQTYNVRSGKQFISLRPIRINQASCVNCHVGARVGDTLGVLAYVALEHAKPIKK